MGRVLITVRVMPEGVESDLDEIAGALKGVGAGELSSLEREPIAFGLVALRASYLVGDEGGVAERLEREIASIRGVRSAEVVEATLV